MPEAYSLQNFTTLDVTESDGDTSVPVAGIRDVTIIPSFEIEDLYTADSVKRASTLRHSFSVQVEIGYSLWDAAFVRQFLGGAGGSESAMVVDTSEPQLFDLTFEIDSEGGAETLGPFTVEDIRFEEMPVFDGSEQEYQQTDISGEGADIIDVSTTDNTV